MAKEKPTEIKAALEGIKQYLYYKICARQWNYCGGSSA